MRKADQALQHVEVQCVGSDIPEAFLRQLIRMMEEHREEIFAGVEQDREKAENRTKLNRLCRINSKGGGCGE